MTLDAALLDRVAQPALDRLGRAPSAAAQAAFTAELALFAMAGATSIALDPTVARTIFSVLYYGSITTWFYRRRLAALVAIRAAEAAMLLDATRNPLRITWRERRYTLIFFTCVVLPLIGLWLTVDAAFALVCGAIVANAAGEYLGSCDLPPARPAPRAVTVGAVP